MPNAANVLIAGCAEARQGGDRFTDAPIAVPL